MRKYVLMAISLLLIIAAILNIPEEVDPPVISGPGDGQNYNVEDLSSFKEVMDYFMGQDSSSSTSSDSDEEPQTETARPTKHTSGTLTEKSNATSRRRHEYVAGYDEWGIEKRYYNETTVNLVRSLTVKMEEDKSHYISKGMLGTKYTTNDPDYENSENLMVFDMEVLVDGDKLFLLFNTFTVVTDGEHQVDFSSIIGKWIRLSDEGVNDMIELLDVANKQSLNEIQKVINAGLGGMKKNGNVYSADVSTYDNDDTSIMLDLSDENVSTLTIATNANGDNYSITENHVLEFYHIDNTVVENNLSDVVKVSGEALEKMLGGIE